MPEKPARAGLRWWYRKTGREAPDPDPPVMRAFGDVKVDKPEQKMVLSVIRGNDRPWTDILEPGETYRVCCPWCDDGKFHLNINHAFGTRDPRTGHLIRLNNCFRCGPHTGELLDLLQWQTVPPPQVTLQQVRPAEGPAAVYTSPGTCVPLSDPRTKLVETISLVAGLTRTERGASTE